MYCIKCGTEINENAKFCLSCGEKVINDEVASQLKETSGDKNRIYAYYISLLTTPALLIIRLLTQTEKYYERGVMSWAGSVNRVEVPGVMQLVMLVLVMVSFFLTAILRKNSTSKDKSKSKITTFMMIFNVIACIAIMGFTYQV